MDYPIGPPMGQGYLAMWNFALSVNSPTVKTCMESCRVCEANFSLGLSQSQQLKARSDVLRKTHQPGLFFTHAKNAAS